MSPSVVGNRTDLAPRPLAVRFRVYAIPATQGSMRAFMPKGGKFPVVTHDNKPRLRSWRDAVASEALRARPGRILNGPLSVVMHFYLPRPKSRPETLRTSASKMKWAYPWRKPDLDKLQRSCLDALTGVLINDDAQIVSMETSKLYSIDPGVEVAVSQFFAEGE